MASSILRNITWLSAGNLLVKPLWFLFIPVLCMRQLGAEGYGLLEAALSMMLLASAFADWGMTPYSTREVARARDQASRFFSNFLALRTGLTLGTLLVALIVGLGLGYSGSKLGTLALAGGYVLPFVLTVYCRSYYRAFEILKYESVSIVVEKVLVVAGGLVMLWLTRSPGGVLGGMAVGMGLTLLLNVAWVSRNLAPLRRDLLEGRFMKRALPVAIPLGLVSIFTMLYTRTDLVMLEAMQSEAAAGQYGVAFRVVYMLVLLPTIIVTVVFPRLSTLFHERQVVQFQRVLWISLLGTVGIAIVVSAGLTFLGPTMVHLMAPGAEFAPAGQLLRVLTWLFPLMTANYLLTFALSAADDQQILAVVLGGAAVVNIGLNLVLIPTYSYYGACAATLLTQGLILIMIFGRFFLHTRPRLAAPELSANPDG